MPCVTITGTECETETGDRSGRVAPSGDRDRDAARVAEAASAESAATAVSAATAGSAASAATAATADGAARSAPGSARWVLADPAAGLPGMFDRQAMFDRHAFGRGPRARKGDVRAAILDLLDEGGQWNGYQLIQEIAGRTSGVWRPSAGSVYPALQQLEDEGLIAPEGEGRRRMYALTDAGRAYAEEHADELSGSWDAVAGMTDDEAIELGDLVRQVMIAVMEVRRAGSPEQLTQARAVLAQTRRSMYRILAEDDPTGTAADDHGHRRHGRRHADGHRHAADTVTDTTAVDDTPDAGA